MIDPGLTLKNLILEEDESECLGKFRDGERRNSSIREEKHYGYRIWQERYGKETKFRLLIVSCLN